MRALILAWSAAAAITAAYGSILVASEHDVHNAMINIFYPPTYRQPLHQWEYVRAILELSAAFGPMPSRN